MSAPRWEKRGRIFGAAGQRPWMMSFAQNPFAEQIEGDLYRIYFSCRDAANRAHIGWVEIDITRPDVPLALSDAPLLAPGAPGRFDDAGVMMSWIAVARGDRYVYYIAWNLRDSKPYHLSVGLAVGPFVGGAPEVAALAAPVLDRSPVDPLFVSSPCVLVEGGLWRMWYLSGLGWPEAGGRTVPSYHLAYAESEDGKTWRPTGEVALGLGPGELGLSRPSILAGPDGYDMWFSFRGEDHRYRLGFARSRDGRTWQREDMEAGVTTSDRGWDSEMIAYPFVFNHGDTQYMLYCGNDYGRDGFGLAARPL
jgi:hypothetical protein